VRPHRGMGTIPLWECASMCVPIGEWAHSFKGGAVTTSPPKGVVRRYSPQESAIPYGKGHYSLWCFNEVSAIPYGATIPSFRGGDSGVEVVLVKFRV